MSSGLEVFSSRSRRLHPCNDAAKASAEPATSLRMTRSGSASSGLPARQGHRRWIGKETIADSSTLIGKLFKAGNDQPNLGKLNQHKMQVVLGAMERNVQDDRLQLQDFLKRCG